MNKKFSIRSVLFDLDGTLLDTAPDLAYALNQLRKAHDLPSLPFTTIRHIASLGSKAMIKFAFEIDENHSQFNGLREQFLTLYENHIADSTRFFPNIENVLNKLDQQQVPWGIVTNKLTKHTLGLLKALNFEDRPGCIICGDSLTTFKPDPAPILHACQLLNEEPQHCVYIGDARTDVLASKAAGLCSLVALYGYINTDEENPFAWLADGYIDHPEEIMNWITAPA
jgi:phosphoglycolate phosphatase